MCIGVLDTEWTNAKSDRRHNMAEILGIGCTHAPMILNPPEQWTNIRKGIASRLPEYRPPAKLLEELGDDDGLS